MKEIIIVTQNGEYRTETSWNLEILAQSLDCSILGEGEKSINIGDYIFKKKDIIMIKPINNTLED